MAIKGFEKKDPMQQFNQMMQIINQMNQMQDRKSRRYMGMYDEFAKNTKSFDNNVLERDLQRMNNYYDNNVSGMSEQDIEYHNMVKNEYTDQIQANKDFDIDIERRHDYGQNMMDIADKYSSADDSWNFSWTETTINRDTGESTETTHGVDMPKAEDYEGGVNNPQYIKDNDEALIAIGGVKGFERKRDDYKRYLKNQLQKEIGGYSDYQELMVKKYAGSGRINNMHIKDFGELDESYAFIVDSLSDDGYFDDEEKEAYQSAIMQKSYSPIKNFIEKDSEIKRYKRSNLMAEMDALEEQGAIISDHLDKAFSAQGGAPGIDVAFTLDEKHPYNASGENRVITNNDIVNTLKDRGKQDPELYQYLVSLEETQTGILEKLKVKDQSFIKNDGGSYISSMEEQPWTASIKDIPQGKVPSMLGGTIIDDGDDGDDKIITDDDISTTNDDKASKIGWAVPAALTTYSLAPDKFNAAAKYTTTALADASKNLSQAFGIDVDQMESFWKSTDAERKFAQLDEFDKKLKNVKKGSKQFNLIKKQQDNLIRSTAKAWAEGKYSKFKDWQWSQQRWEQMLKSRNKYNFFKFKRDLKNKLSGDMFNKLFDKSGGVVKTAIKGIGSRVVPFAIGQNIAEEAGLSKKAQLTAGAASTAIVPQISKAIGPKIGRMLGTKAGKKALINFIAKQTSKKIATGIVAGGGIASWITGAVGVGLAAKDIYQFVKNFDE